MHVQEWMCVCVWRGMCVLIQKLEVYLPDLNKTLHGPIFETLWGPIAANLGHFVSFA